MTDPDARSGRANEAGDLLRMRAAAVGVDVAPIRRVVRDAQVRSQFPQNAWRRFVSRAVRAIHSTGEAVQG